MDKTKFAMGIEMLAEFFGKQVSEAILEGYWIALSDLTDDEYRKAVTAALKQSKFFPAGAELRAFAGRKRLEAPYHAPAKLSPDLGKWTRGELPGDWRVPKRLCAMVDEAKGTG